jgi:arylsulfatase A-like enzyme
MDHSFCFTLVRKEVHMPAPSVPNIVAIMADDIGWFNLGAYHQGIMASRTPNLDRLAAEGMRFTDYYAEASCTAGRANFITGELPIRTGLTTVGQAGAKVGMPDQAPTIATALKSMGYATGQFGKNHLGDLNQYLPTLHGFDEFFGYLYHLDAMEDPSIHRTSKTRSGLATWCTAGPPIKTIRPSTRAGGKSGSSGLKMPARSTQIAWRPSTMRFWTTP